MTSPPKSSSVRALQQVDQHFGLEHIDAHRAQEGAVGVLAADEAFLQIGILGLFDEIGDVAARSLLEQAEAEGLLTRHRLHGDGDVGVLIPVETGQVAVIHAVQVVAGQDQGVGGVGRFDLDDLLAHGVGGALVPGVAARGLLGRQDLDPAAMESVEDVGARDVPVQGDRVELGQDGDAGDAGVDAVADGDVDQAVLAGDGHGGLGPLVGQRVQARAAPAAQDQSQDVLLGWHGLSPELAFWRVGG